MLQDSAFIEKRHKRFITTVCESQIVYGLKNNQGFASSSSTQYEDENGKPIMIICFWAEKALAKSCAKNEWNNYSVCEISLSEFIENWCVGMENDGLLIGTQFDQNMFGYEAEPLELILELLEKLKETGRKLNFKKFNDIADIEKQVKAII